MSRTRLLTALAATLVLALGLTGVVRAQTAARPDTDDGAGAAAADDGGDAEPTAATAPVDAVVQQALTDLAGRLRLEASLPSAPGEQLQLQLTPDPATLTLPPSLTVDFGLRVPEGAELPDDPFQRACELLKLYDLAGAATQCAVEPPVATVAGAAEPSAARAGGDEEPRLPVQVVYERIVEKIPADLTTYAGDGGIAARTAALADELAGEGLITVEQQVAARRLPETMALGTLDAVRSIFETADGTLRRNDANAPGPKSPTEERVVALLLDYYEGRRPLYESYDALVTELSSSPEQTERLVRARTLTADDSGTGLQTELLSTASADTDQLLGTLLETGETAEETTDQLVDANTALTSLLQLLDAGHVTNTLSAVHLTKLLDELQATVPTAVDLPIEVCVSWTITRDGQPANVVLPEAARTSSGPCTPTVGPGPHAGQVVTPTADLAALVEPAFYELASAAELAIPPTSDLTITADVTLRVNGVTVKPPQALSVALPLPKLPVPSLALAFTGRNYGPNVLDPTAGSGGERIGYAGVFIAVPESSPFVSASDALSALEELQKATTKLRAFASFADKMVGISAAVEGLRTAADLAAAAGNPNTGAVFLKANAVDHLNDIHWVTIPGNDDIEVEDEIRSVIVLGARPICFFGARERKTDEGTRRYGRSDILVNTLRDVRLDGAAWFSSYQWGACPS